MMNRPRRLLSMLVVAAASLAQAGANGPAQPSPAQQRTVAASVKPATEITKAANAMVLSSLPFSDKLDFEDAQRGFVAKPDTLTLETASGAVAWDLESYKRFSAGLEAVLRGT